MEFIEKVMAFLQSEWIMAVVGFLFLSIEYWLGKTELVKAGSTVEVILSSISKVLSFFKPKTKE